MKKYIARAEQAFNKFFFCLRIAADSKTFLQLLVQSKMLKRYPKDLGSREYDRTAKALPYRIRFLSIKRTIYLRTYAGDIWMFYEIFWEQAYRLPATAPASPLVILDAGANIGMAALYFSIVYPSARIYCMEPDTHNFNLLRENLATDRDRTVLIEAALYDRDGSVGLARERWAYNSKIAEDGSSTVKAISMDTLMDQFRLEQIDLLKIDIEGAEHRLFDGGTAWLQRVHTILIEVHASEATGPISEATGPIRNRLMENGFRCQVWDRKAGNGLPDSLLFLASRAEMSRLALP